MFLSPFDLSSLPSFKALLKAVPTQEIGFQPFVGMEVEFTDAISYIHEIAHTLSGDIAIVPIPPGFRSLVFKRRIH